MPSSPPFSYELVLSYRKKVESNYRRTTPALSLSLSVSGSASTFYRESVSCMFLYCSACYSSGFVTLSLARYQSWPNGNGMVFSLPRPVPTSLFLDSFRGSRDRAKSAGSCGGGFLQDRPTTCHSVFLAGSVGQACQMAEHHIENESGHFLGNTASQALLCAGIRCVYIAVCTYLGRYQSVGGCPYYLGRSSYPYVCVVGWIRADPVL
ncbi:hypothetical protein LX36DRAFT_303080 [Colletotrichum falcatum]|nr:hypothetical protein LX36DRAFT_303080 [Colletotrichum falcatum]